MRRWISIRTKSQSNAYPDFSLDGGLIQPGWELMQRKFFFTKYVINLSLI
jgi:hypothetical protein